MNRFKPRVADIQQQQVRKATISVAARRNARLLRAALSLVCCVVLVAFCVLVVDRPVSSWTHAHFGNGRFALFTAPYDGHPLAIGPFTLLAVPAEILGQLAPLILIVAMFAAAAGWRPARRGHVLLLFCIAIIVAIEVNREVKAAFGRTWPESWLGDNPSWIGDGTYGFFPLHGGGGWRSFPSGHTTVAATVATLLWVFWPRLRILGVALVLASAIGLIGADYHFVGDIVGGTYLGIVVGIAVAALSRRWPQR